MNIQKNKKRSKKITGKAVIGKTAIVVELASFAFLASMANAEILDPELRQINWPAVNSSIEQDPTIEEAVNDLLSHMSLEEKVGQMMQPEIAHISWQDIRDFHLGSVLNGGGSHPNFNTRASVKEWVDLADFYWNTSMDDSDGKVAIPMIWGTDSVHGHNNVIGATVFPHNIGLGATNNPELIRNVGEITAKEVTVTGIDWAFAPTLAVVRDDRWGRTYEGYSEDPVIVKRFAGKMVEGLQGIAGSSSLFDESHIVATAKHFVGDGGTFNGDDQGNNLSTAQQLHDIHLQGYITALEAGVQTVMASYSSWQGTKMHGSKDMLTGILKEEMGFDGFVIGDWYGHGQVPGCTKNSCAQAINAGVDMMMVPYERAYENLSWKDFYWNTISQVNSGEITQTRIDDAVGRILRVKLRAGLWDLKPSERMNANNTALLGAPAHRDIARQAVRESLVLLKNDSDILPLAKSSRVLVAGSGADNIGKQSGGWSIFWQGVGDDNSYFPNAKTILSGIENQVAGHGGNVTFSENGDAANLSQHDVAIVVFGEAPYAEFHGDIEPTSTLEYQRGSKTDLALLRSIRGKGIPVVAVFLSGRPVWVNKELNHSDAFVAAWLPGSEGDGISEVLFGDYDFKGKLSYSWPKAVCQTDLNVNDENYDPLFEYGFGLTYSDSVDLGLVPDSTAGYENGCVEGGTDVDLDVLVGAPNAPFSLYVGDRDNWKTLITGKSGSSVDGTNIKVASVDKVLQEDARSIEFSGNNYGIAYLQSPETNQAVYLNSGATLSFDVRVNQAPLDSVELRVECGYPCRGGVDITDLLRQKSSAEWESIKVDLKCFADAGTDFSKIDSGFWIGTNGAFTATYANIKWQRDSLEEADVLCSTVPLKSVIDIANVDRNLEELVGDSVTNVWNRAATDAGSTWAINLDEVADQDNNAKGARRVTFNAFSQWYYETVEVFSLQDHELLSFDIKVNTAATQPVVLRIGGSWPARSEVDITELMPSPGEWKTINIPRLDFEIKGIDGFNIWDVRSPFVLINGGGFSADIANITWQ